MSATESIESVFGRIGFVLILVIVVLTTLLYGTVHQPILALFYVSIGLLAFLWLIDSIRTGRFRFDSSYVPWTLLAAAVYGIIQSIPFGYYGDGGLEGIPRTISSEPHVTLVASFHFLVLFVFLKCSLVSIDSSKRLRTVLGLVFVFGSIYAFYAILQLVLSPGKIYGIYSSPFANPIGSFVNRHNFAAFMEMTILLSSGILVTAAIKPDRRLVYFTGVGIMGIALLLSGSRGGFVSVIAGVFFLILLSTVYEKRGNLIFRLGGAALIVVAIVVGSVFISAESTTFKRISETATSDDVTTNRTQIWEATMGIISKGMPLGVGMGAYGVNYSPFDSGNGLERVEQAHNDYLEVLAVAGIPGLLIGIAFIVFLFREGMRGIRAHDRYIRGASVGGLAGVFAILVHSLFDFVLHTTAVAIMFLLLVSVVIVTSRMATLEPKREKRKRSKPRNVTPIKQEVG